MEVSGEFACFTRPELKSERFSYEVMTPSAARGVLESIFWKPEFDYVIVKIDVLKPIRWFSIRRNEVKSMVSEDWVRRAMADPRVRYDVESDRDQRNTVGLRDVAYRIYAQIRLRAHATESEVKYREQFRRRVDKSACYSQPFLGTREFSARFGKNTGAKPISDLRDKDKDLGVMLHSIGYGSDGGETYRWFLARLDNGVLHVPPQGMVLPSAGPVKRGRRGEC
ncbi:type I-C CRISPR-associated protein Cas5 [Nocardia terpenica]|nr:type I-C CRISPR-associated protein Cas5 [Nocardia terpenica]MBF6106149.1 type I-C CRISPR-associated protein Cas5 [Nocardia terpenica]MBF6110471.1 type I-C CRISPR-associated protein Cas5 [Nocardia terpenica]MBF6120692.1 type I-C CRISPR-associated protein Cas5 [Nocardia terpenica]MBF6151807.1 type I-C CRISPR-associated protein Cas5 [Nocardia terpenica]